MTAITGPNGAGKSTLLKAIMGELPLAEGTIERFGLSACDVGYLPQAGFQSGAGFPATAEEIVKANLFSQIGLLRSPIQ